MGVEEMGVEEMGVEEMSVEGMSVEEMGVEETTAQVGGTVMFDGPCWTSKYVPAMGWLRLLVAM